MAPSAVPMSDLSDKPVNVPASFPVSPASPPWAPPVEEEMPSQLQHLSFGPNALSGQCHTLPTAFSSKSRLTSASGIPSFPSFQSHREHIVLHMAAVFRNWARVGFTEGISGHISVRDPEYPGCIWMNPIGRHFALLNASDMLCIEINSGAIVGGNRVCSPSSLSVTKVGA